MGGGTRWALVGVLLVLAVVPARAEIPGPVETRSARAGDLDLRLVIGAGVVLGERRLFFEHARDRVELPHLQAELGVVLHHRPDTWPENRPENQPEVGPEAGSETQPAAQPSAASEG